MRSEEEKNRFDICDDITSGDMQGFCTTRNMDFEKHKRDASFTRDILVKFNEAEKAAYKKLKKASDKFIDAQSENEVDLSGTGRSAFVAEEQDIQQRDFLQSVQAYEKGKDNRYTKDQYKKADKELNEVYTKVMRSSELSLWGTVTKDQIKSTQVVWLKYRDAWVEFGKMRYPKVSSDSIAAWFTKKRIHMLRAFAELL